MIVGGRLDGITRPYFSKNLWENEDVCDVNKVRRRRSREDCIHNPINMKREENYLSFALNFFTPSLPTTQVKFHQYL